MSRFLIAVDLLFKTLVLAGIRPLENRLLRLMELHGRTSPATQVAQKRLWAHWRDLAGQGKPQPLDESGFRCFSQFEEDGLLLRIFAILGIHTGFYLDLGCADGINSNCANLALNFGWDGVNVDGDDGKLEKGRSYYARHWRSQLYPPRFVQAMINSENVNDVAQAARVPAEIDLLSIDIDGNDYWVWRALEVTTPKVVIVETNVVFGDRNIVVPYDPRYVYPGKHPYYHGASPVAMEKLARTKGYRLVGSSLYGFNTIYVREGLADNLLPKVPVSSVLAHPRNQGFAADFASIAGWEYLEG